tara:strand:- start:1028 stop:1309 length:282 start_codon:yes stop_codon:yes gene_type:complete
MSLDELVKLYYKPYEPLKFNCARLLYIEHALKKNKITRAVSLANCFINMYSLKCSYADEIMSEIKNNCPEIFKNELRVPEFYMNNVKNILNKY